MVIESVTISAPSTATVNTKVSVSVQAKVDVSEIMENIVKYRLILDLLVDGKLYESKMLPLFYETENYSATFTWVPTKVGKHELVGRARLVIKEPYPSASPMEFWQASLITVEVKESPPATVDVKPQKQVSPSSEPLGSIISVSVPEQVFTGSTFETKVTVKNVGTEPGSFTIVVKWVGSVMGRASVFLKGGEEKTIEIPTRAPSSPGAYTYKVVLFNDTTGYIDDVKSVVVIATPSLGPVPGTKYPEAKIVSVDVPQTVAAGQEVDIKVSVTNLSNKVDFSGILEIVSAEGNVVASAPVSIPPSKTITVDLKMDAPRYPGNYVYYIKLIRSSDSKVVSTYTIKLNVAASKVVTPSLKPPRGKIVEVRYPSEVEPGEIMNIVVYVENQGDRVLEGQVWIRREGVVISSKRIEINPREQTEVDFSIKAPKEPGKYVYEAVVYDAVTKKIDDDVKFDILVVEKGKKKSTSPQKKTVEKKTKEETTEKIAVYVGAAAIIATALALLVKWARRG